MSKPAAFAALAALLALVGLPAFGRARETAAPAPSPDPADPVPDPFVFLPDVPDVAFPSLPEGVQGGDVVAVVDAGSGYTTVRLADGTVQRRTGVRAWRNNNPGNIEYGPFARSFGAVGTDGRFAVFPSLQVGRDAKAALIFEGANYRDLSLSAAIARYAPPSENNTAAYVRAVLAAVGGADRRMADYGEGDRAAILDAMARVEGYRVGSIQTVSGGVA